MLNKCRSRPVSRVLSRGRSSSAAYIPLGRALPRVSSERYPEAGAGSPSLALRRDSLPICSCTRWGLPCHLRHRRRGALLPHRFTLATRVSRRRSAVCSLWHFPAGHPDRSLTGTLPYGARTFLGDPCPADRRVRPGGSGDLDVTHPFYLRTSRGTPFFGQRSSSGQREHAGVSALHVRRPCQTKSWCPFAQRASGRSAMRSRSTFDGSVSRESPSLRDTRPTCVSTGNACAAPRWTSTTPAVFGPTPGRPSSASRVR